MHHELPRGVAGKVIPIGARGAPDATKSRILDAAESLFMEHGFEATSLRSITTTAGVNLAAVNYHFGSKEELFQAVLTRRLDPMNQERVDLLTRLEQESAPAPVACERILAAMFVPALKLARGLGARLELLAPAPPPRLAPATPMPVRLRVTNTGDTRWLTGSPTERGAVCLGVQLRDGAGGMLARDYCRVPLPRAVDPGETIEIRAAVPAPPEPGRFRLVFDLVTEQICWFEHHGSPSLPLDLETKA